MTDVLTAAGRLDGKIVIDAANMMGPNRLSLRQLADAFPAARWVRSFNTLQARVWPTRTTACPGGCCSCPATNRRSPPSSS